MSQMLRFGRRVPLPSTAEIKHELRLMAAAAELRATADSQRGVLASELARTHGLSIDRAQMLVDRFGLGLHVGEAEHAGFDR